jgi:zinc protease
VDRRTLALGGHNNAYTKHDATLYHFSFASDRWLEALDMEADRMAGLLLAPEEVDRERAVVVEEIGLADDDPWEALEKEVHEAFFDGHPYGRPILGNRESLAAIGREELAEFHRRRYRAGNAVLVVAGEVGDDLVDAVAQRFAALDPGTPTAPRGSGGSREPGGLRRVVRRQGEVARLLIALPSPAAGGTDFAPLRVLLTVLGGGRASRLHRALVDEEELCLSVSTEIAEMQEPGLAEIALELVGGAEPEEVEKRVLAEVSELAEGPIRPEEVTRAQRMLLADWAFEAERIHQQALLYAVALALFDGDYLRRHLRQILACDVELLTRVGRTYLDPERGGVIGWSLAQP